MKWYITNNNEVYMSETPAFDTDIEIPERPKPNYLFNRDTLQWEHPYKNNVEDYRIFVINDILKPYRQEQEYAGPFLPFGDQIIRFPSEIKDEIRLNSVSNLFKRHPEIPAIPNWKIDTNTYITITPELIEMVQDAGFMHINKMFEIERMKIEELEQLETVEDIDNWIVEDLEIGWIDLPQIGGEEE